MCVYYKYTMIHHNFPRLSHLIMEGKLTISMAMFSYINRGWVDMFYIPVHPPCIPTAWFDPSPDSGGMDAHSVGALGFAAFLGNSAKNGAHMGVCLQKYVET